MDAALVVQAGLGHRRVGHDAQAEERRPRRLAGRHRHAEAGRRREVAARRVRHQFALVNVASTCEELSKRLLSDSSTCTWKLPGSAPPRFWTVKLTGTVSPAAAMSTPVRNELPVKSGISGADVVRLTSRVYSPVVPPGTPLSATVGL